MTTATPPRPAASPQPRRPAGPTQSGAAAASVDPLKLLKKHKLTLIIATIVGIGVGIGGHFAWLYTWPFWTARVVYQCYPPQTELGEETGTGSGSEEELARFMATQVALMTSDRVLSKAAEDPRLVEEAPKWSRQFFEGGRFNTAEAALELSEAIRARIVSGTELIQLSMIWRNKIDVAGVVSVVNDAYLSDLNLQRRIEHGNEKDAVAEAIQDIDREIDKLTEERETILREAGIDSLDDRVGSVQQSIALANEQRSELLVQMEGVRDELETLEAELRSAQGTPTYPDAMRQEVEQHSLILQQKAQIQAMESELSGLQQSGIGPEHRDYKRLRARLDGYRQKLQNTREQLLDDTLHSRIDSLRQFLRQAAAQEADLAQRIREDKARMNDLLRIQGKVTDIQNEIELAAASKAEFQQKLTTLEQLDDLSTASRVVIAENVRVPAQVTFPKIYIMVPLGVILTLGLTAGVVMIAETVDQRVKGPQDVAVISRTRVLGLIPHGAEDPSNPKSLETVFADHERGVIAESYRQLRASLMKSMRRGNHRSLLVIAGMPGSGSTSIISNLALACAASDQRVLVVDANLRRPRLHLITGTAEGPGLADVLGCTSTLETAVQRSADGRVDVLTAGTPDQRVYERLAAQRMDSLLAEAAERYELILLDVAPAVVAGDASELANHVDATCLVTRAYAEKRGMVARLRNELDESRGEFLGVIVNGVRSSAGGYFKRNIRATHRYQKA